MYPDFVISYLKWSMLDFFRIVSLSKWTTPPIYTALIHNATYIATEYNQSYGQTVPIKCNHICVVHLSTALFIIQMEGHLGGK